MPGANAARWADEGRRGDRRGGEGAHLPTYPHRCLELLDLQTIRVGVCLALCHPTRPAPPEGQAPGGATPDGGGRALYECLPSKKSPRKRNPHGDGLLEVDGGEGAAIVGEGLDDGGPDHLGGE